MRLDKYLTLCGLGTRSECRDIIKKKCICIDETIVTDPSVHVDDKNIIMYGGKRLIYEEYIYLMLNKPSGFVSARTDTDHKTVMDLIDEKRKDLSPVGRLDKDTVGLLLITDNGTISHNMLSPKKHVDKTYFFKSEKILSDEDIKKLCNGVDIGDEKPTLPCVCERSEDGYLLTIREGRYHQIKRMLEAVDNKVTYLKRISFGPLKLDETLKEGSYRRLNKDELEMLLEYM